MSSSKNIYCHLFIFNFYIAVFPMFPNSALCDNARSNLIVEFDPHVSILDWYDQNRYNISELVPIVTKVAEKFDRVLIDLKDAFHPDILSGDVFPVNLTSSLLLSSLAVSTYNAQRTPSQPKLSVWLVDSGSLLGANPIPLSRILKFIATKTNDIYENTVTALLLPASDISNQTMMDIIRSEQVYESFVFKNTYKWGVIKESYSCEFHDIQHVSLLKADIIIFYYGERTFEPRVPLDCKQYQENNAARKHAFWFRNSDTTEKGVISMSRLVAKWKSLERFAGQNSIVVSSAFDTWCEFGRFCYATTSPTANTNGWWRLRESPDYLSTADYIFETKEKVAEKFDREANSINATLVEEKDDDDYQSVVYRQNTGVIFGFSETSFLQQIEQLHPEESLISAKITNKIVTSFSKIATVLDSDDSDSIAILADETRFIHAHFLESMDYIVVVIPGIQLSKNIIALFGGASNTTYLATQRTPMFVLSYEKETFAYTITNQQLITEYYDKHDKLRISFLLPISYCARFPYLKKTEKTQVIELLSLSSVVFFGFEDELPTVRLGAERMFQQRVVTFSQCGKFLKQLKSDNPSIGELEPTFIMLHYSNDNRYENVMEIYHFVMYWQKLRDWAATTKTPVILNNALDSDRYTVAGDGKRLEMGWWRHQLTPEGDGIARWVDKKTDILQHVDYISKRFIPEQSVKTLMTSDGLSYIQIIITSVAVSIVVISFLGVVFYFGLRRHYRQQISREEMHSFFQGNQDSNECQYKLSYDKSRFEIEPKSFSVDYNRLLGSGEFGVVCAGKVKTSAGMFVDVAVKMVKSNKFHRNSLTGLLSEIKVLAHVGKHENLIELIGASTSSLKRGKIHVFLELGELGSLGKYLRNLRHQPCKDAGGTQEEGDIELESTQGTVLNPLLSQDLYRWSKEICNGMSFLAAKHVVHADLATRNVLLNADKTAKICDFGLSRRMYNYTNYVKQGHDPLPWKWLPPESLTRMEFSEKSDVWAYGVTLWEIYSLGDTPYPGLSWEPNFSRILEQGFRMDKPKYNDRNIYSIMMECWSTNPTERPSFANLIARLEDYGNANEYLNLD